MSAQQSNQDVNVVGIPPSGTHTTNVVPQTEANQRPSDSETASHPNIAGATKISSSETGTEPSGETGSGSPGLDTTQDSYPEQRHAGAVGYGPSYNKGVGAGEKIAGIKETIVGKVKKDPELVEHGQLRKTGELKRREEAENEVDPFASPEDKAADQKAPTDTAAKQAATTAPEGTEKAAGQTGGNNPDGAKIIG